MLMLLNNPVIQGTISNFIFLGIQAGGTELFSNSLSEQFKILIQKTSDKLLEKYSIKEIKNGITFWG